jgi:hypothetical protein
MPRAAIGMSLVLAQGLLTQAPFVPSLFAQNGAPQASATSAADEIVAIERLTVKGSRLEAGSVRFLSGLRPGMKVNEAAVRRAAQRIADSGLVKNVGYQYQSLSSDRSVELEFTIADETPLLPATIEIPDVDAEDVWAYLRGIDPVFTRELPRTQKAIAFYTRYIERYLAAQKRTLRVATVITADESGNASGIVFVPASLLGTPQLKGRPPLPGAKP